ncbi:hypothetical protein [Brachyspira sp.]|nr:hypothetical protein [Brachyspira sp.]
MCISYEKDTVEIIKSKDHNFEETALKYLDKGMILLGIAYVES